jgi:hypothetical protein
MIVSSNTTADRRATGQPHKAIAPKASHPGSTAARPGVTSDVVSSSTSSQRATSASCRRRIAFHPTLGYAIAPTLPAKVARRNARERNRVKQVPIFYETPFRPEKFSDDFYHCIMDSTATKNFDN